jgi:hypothetical integral membrane protein (TIGR02206 family)
MDQFFALNYSGAPFALFGPAHLVALALVLCANLALIWVRHGGLRLRNTIRYTLAGILLVVETSWHLWNYFTGQWTLQTMLPLHLCSALVWLSIVMLLTKNYRIYEFAYLLGIAGALQALLTPDAGRYGFPHFRFFQVMLSHGTLVTAAMFMTVVEGFRPTPRSMLRVLVGSNLYLAAVGLVNWAIGSNYLFVAHKPVTASLLDALPAWPWYILYIEALGVIFVLLFYLPFAIKDWRAKNKSITPQNASSG